MSRCTAVIVAPDTAATAAHCLYSRALGHTVPVGSIHLLLGYDGGSFTRHIIPRAVRFAPGSTPGAHEPRSNDLALLQFAPPVATTLEPVTEPVRPATPLRLGGFGQDRAQRLLVDPGCAALGYVHAADGPPLLRHDCNGTRGTSGGAMVMQDPDGRWRLAGLQVAGETGGAGGLAVPGFTIAAMLATAP